MQIVKSYLIGVKQDQMSRRTVGVVLSPPLRRLRRAQSPLSGLRRLSHASCLRLAPPLRRLCRAHCHRYTVTLDFGEIEISLYNK